MSKASRNHGIVGEKLARQIALSGPIPVSHYMAEANGHYYATRDPFGAAGDFTTAPEISQMFGELVGLWLAELWVRAGRPERTAYVELGPGRGTLAADALRAMRAAGLDPSVHLVEASPVLRAAQAERLPHAAWHDDASTLPQDCPLLVVANEFFDALPIRQLVNQSGRWHELMVGYEDGRFVRKAGPVSANAPVEAEEGAIVETSPASAAIAADLAHRVAEQGGAALIVDYGHVRTGVGDTLQAVARHAYADPWTAPGTRDLTAHVDFQALAQAAGQSRVAGPVSQGAWLEAMGIGARAATLARAAPHRAGEIAAARTRLTAPEHMGDLFKVLALVAPAWPAPEGFA
mgnify:CR=1 FL=1